MDDWFRPLSEPVRQPPRLREALQRFEAPDTSVGGPILMSQWFAPLNVPTPRVQGLKPSQQQATAMDPQSMTDAEAVTVDRWLIPLSQPIRTKRPVAFQLAMVWHFQTEVVTLDKWYAPWREPARLKRGLRASLQMTTTISPFGMTLPETTLVSKWFQPLSEPIRLRPKLSGAILSTFATGQLPPPPFVPTFAVYAPMTDNFAVDGNPCCEEEC